MATNNTSETSEDVIQVTPTQRSVASKVKQCLKLKRKIPVKRLDFGLCSSPHTSMQMDNFNFDHTEIRPPEKEMSLHKYNV